MSDSEIFITGYPRSANTWLNRLISDILDSPLKNTADMQPVYYGAMGGKYVVRKRHAIAKEGKTIFIYRDPRDVVVSRMYYHGIPSIQSAIGGMVKATNGDQRDISGSLIGRYEPFIHTWYNTGKAEAQITYEQLHQSPVQTLQAALKAVTGETIPDAKIEQAIKRQSFNEYIAAHGKEHAMRKGIVGDWRNHFTRSDGELITTYLGDLMLEQGYIDNQNWYMTLPEKHP